MIGKFIIVELKNIMAVHFHYQTPVTLTRRTELKKFIQALFKRENTPMDTLAIIYCTDEYLLDINKQFLQHDFYTDIVTFNLAESKANPVVGELYISVHRVKENARSVSQTSSRELHRVIFHGALHLCGYKDKTKKDKHLMTAKEEEYLSLYF